MRSTREYREGVPIAVEIPYLFVGTANRGQPDLDATTQINSIAYNYDQVGSQLSWNLDPEVTVITNKISKIDRGYWSTGAMKTRTGSAGCEGGWANVAR